MTDVTTLLYRDACLDAALFALLSFYRSTDVRGRLRVIVQTLASLGGTVASISFALQALPHWTVGKTFPTLVNVVVMIPLIIISTSPKAGNENGAGAPFDIRPLAFFVVNSIVASLLLAVGAWALHAMGLSSLRFGLAFTFTMLVSTYAVALLSSRSFQLVYPTSSCLDSDLVDDVEAKAKLLRIRFGRVRVYNDESVNAMVFPYCNDIFVSRGLLRYERSAVLAVCAHELSHLHLRHGAIRTRYAGAAAIAGTVVVFFGSSALQKTALDASYGTLFTVLFVALANSLFIQLPMSRKQEREADAFAARLVGDGIYRESLRTLWAHLDTGDAVLSRFVASHPSIRERAF